MNKKPWSKLQREIYDLISPDIRFQIHCAAYPMNYWLVSKKLKHGMTTVRAKQAAPAMAGMAAGMAGHGLAEMPGMAAISPHSRMKPCRTSGSPPVRRTLLMP